MESRELLSRFNPWYHNTISFSFSKNRVTALFYTFQHFVFDVGITTLGRQLTLSVSRCLNARKNNQILVINDKNLALTVKMKIYWIS